MVMLESKAIPTKNHLFLWAISFQRATPHPAGSVRSPDEWRPWWPRSVAAPRPRVVYVAVPPALPSIRRLVLSPYYYCARSQHASREQLALASPAKASLRSLTSRNQPSAGDRIWDPGRTRSRQYPRATARPATRISPRADDRRRGGGGTKTNNP